MVAYLTGVPARGDDIAVFYALDADQRALAAASTATRAPIRVGNRSIAVHSIAGHKVYAVKMGSGAVETAVSAEALLSRFPVDQAFSVGPIGSLKSGVKRGAWYRVSQVVAYQKGTYQNGSLQVGEAFDLSGANPEIFDKMDAELDHPPLVVVASGEIFVASADFRSDLTARTGAGAVEMNLFGLRAACENHQVPLYAWRICSDSGDESAGQTFRDFTESYPGTGGKALVELIKSLPSNKASPSSYENLQKLLLEK